MDTEISRRLPIPDDGTATAATPGVGPGQAGEKPGAAEPDGLAQALLRYGPPLAVLDDKGSVHFANAAFHDLTEALVAAKSWPPAGDLMAVIEARGGPIDEAVMIERDGQTRFFLVTHDILRAEAEDRSFVVSRYTPADGMGQRLRALELSDERFRDVMDLGSELVWESGADLEVTFLSPRMLKLLGRQANEVIGRPWSAFVKDAEAFVQVLRDPAKRKPFHSLTLRLVDRDGAEHPFLMHGLPVHDRRSGAFLGFRGTARGLSDHLAQEAALRRAAEAAEAANRAKSDFLANISHELRTPLNAIIGLSDLMVSGKTGAIVCDRYREYLIDIRESGQHLLSVINQILTLAKSEAGRIELIEEDVDPIRLVRSALRVVTETARQRGVMLALSLPCTQLTLRADEGKLRQILLNLLSNALKFTPEDGTVECILRRDADGGVCFEVRDTGIGIDPDQVETAFAPFGQIALPTGGPLGRKAQGTGLGLPISRGLAEAHGGTLELDSTPGEGTTVRVRLPASRVHAT